jgi:hypothetical protein
MDATAYKCLSFDQVQHGLTSLQNWRAHSGSIEGLAAKRLHEKGGLAAAISCAGGLSEGLVTTEALTVSDLVFLTAKMGRARGYSVVPVEVPVLSPTNLALAALLAIVASHVPASFLPVAVEAYFIPPVGAANFSQGYSGEFCPSECYGKGVANPPHGYCKLFGNDRVPLCQCSDDWNGGAWDCSERTCPAAKPWFAMPTSDTEAHSGTAKCSNKGSCDYDSGLCRCGAGFEGHACQRMSCPGWDKATKTSCSGHGRCLSMAEIGLQKGYANPSTAASLNGFYQGGKAGGYGGNAVQYTGWEKDMIMGCVCDPGWGGYDCSVRECPYGSDPHYRGNLEVQRVRTVISTKQREIQLVTLGATPMPTLDVDEVQTITIEGVIASGNLPSGTFRIGFDSTGGDGKCKLCIVSAAATTSAITLSGSAGSIATDAASVRAALEALTNIGTGGVTVAGSVANGQDYVFAVTFVGNNVGGDVSLLTLNLAGLGSTYNAGGSTGVAQTKAGSEIQGTVTLKYDDATTNPTLASLIAGGDTTDSAALALEGDRTAVISYGASASAIAAAIQGMVFPNILSLETPPANAIVVNRIGSGGPGIAWSVTFADGVRARGNIATMTVPADTLSMQAHPDLGGVTATTSAVVTTTQEGTFLGGTWNLQMSWTAEDGSTRTTPLSTALDWNASPSAVASAIYALDATAAGVVGTGGYGIGKVTVTRARSSLISNTKLWSGEYEWLITFSSCSENVPEMPVPTGASLTDGSGGGATGNDPIVRAPRFTVTTITEGGDGTGEVNEVQLIDCRCSGSACTSAGSHYIRLGFTPLPNAAGRRGGAVVASSLSDYTSANGGSFPSALSPGVRTSSKVLANGVEIRYGPYGQVVEVTPPIPYSATAADVAAALAALPSIPAVTVNFYDSESSTATATTVCDADGVTTAITFTHNPGPQYPLSIHTPSIDMKLPSYGVNTGSNGLTNTYFSIRSAASSAPTTSPADSPTTVVRGMFGGRARLGTRVLLPCSGRGTCDTSTGTCSCYTMRSAGTGTSTTQIGTYGDSNNAGGELSAAAPTSDDGDKNCGYPDTAVANCLATTLGGVCNGQGTCSGAAGGYKCICNAGFTGPACEYAKCPTTFTSTKAVSTPARAWFDVATSPIDAHATGTVCSNKGFCGFTTVLSGSNAGAISGSCQCASGFRGPACELTQCPEGGTFASSSANGHADTCANGNECLTIRDYGLNYRLNDLGEWLNPATSADKIDYSTPWDAVQIRGCGCNRTRSYVGGGRGSSSPGVYAGWPSDYSSPAASNTASKDTAGGGSSFGSLTTATGWNCKEYNCPGGHDPMDKALQATYSNNMAVNKDADIDNGKNKHPYEVQKIVCYLEGGNVVASFRNSSTRGFPAVTYVKNSEAPFVNVTGSLYTFERALNELMNVTGDIKVTTATAGSLLCGAGGKTTYITFRSLEGDLPLVRLTPSTNNCPTAPGGTSPCIFVTEEQAGSIGNYPCSRRGKCVRETGLCSCQPQFLSSNGMFRPGNRGDCGHTDALQGFIRDLASTPQKYTDYPEKNIFGL